MLPAEGSPHRSRWFRPGRELLPLPPAACTRALILHPYHNLSGEWYPILYEKTRSRCSSTSTLMEDLGRALCHISFSLVVLTRRSFHDPSPIQLVDGLPAQIEFPGGER